MKLQHLSKLPEGSSKRIQEIGKAMVSEVKLSEIKKPGKKKPNTEVGQDMRDFAVDQLASSECHSAHHKIKHYD
jgi:hypothetical protein